MICGSIYDTASFVTRQSCIWDFSRVVMGKGSVWLHGRKGTQREKDRDSVLSGSHTVSDIVHENIANMSFLNGLKQ